jgi:hypothetical protein
MTKPPPFKKFPISAMENRKVDLFQSRGKGSSRPERLSSVNLIFNGRLFPVQKTLLLGKLQLFERNPVFLKQTEFQVRSIVHPTIAIAFVKAIEGEDIGITTRNYFGLRTLCDEFEFDELADRLLDFRPNSEEIALGDFADGSGANGNF